MRLKEFTTQLFSATGFNLPDQMPCDYYLTLLENSICGKSILEDVNNDSVEYIQSLRNELDIPIIGQRYAGCLVILTNNQIHYLDRINLSELVDVYNEEQLVMYKFVSADGSIHNWPDSRLSALSYTVPLIFSNQEQYNKIAFALILKYSKPMPKVTFNESH